MMIRCMCSQLGSKCCAWPWSHNQPVEYNPSAIPDKHPLTYPAQGAFLDLRLFESRDPGALNLAAIGTGGIRSLGVAEVGTFVGGHAECY
jgi:hypothetical protein